MANFTAFARVHAIHQIERCDTGGPRLLRLGFVGAVRFSPLTCARTSQWPVGPVPRGALPNFGFTSTRASRWLQPARKPAVPAAGTSHIRHSQEVRMCYISGETANHPMQTPSDTMVVISADEVLLEGREGPDCGARDHAEGLVHVRADPG